MRDQRALKVFKEPKYPLQGSFSLSLCPEGVTKRAELIKVSNAVVLWNT